MSWVFARENDAGRETDTYEARSGWTMHLIRSAGGMLAAPTAPPDKEALLGIAKIEPWCVKLHAVRQPLRVVPGSPRNDASTDPPTEEYTVQPETDGRTEIIILRKNDRIYSSQALGRLALTWKAPQVQVNSSVTADGEIPEVEDQQVQGDASNPEEETEDDEDLDQTVVNAVQPTTRSTPSLSASREVVQETPTVDRVKKVVDSPTKQSFSPIGETPPEEIHPEKPSEEVEDPSTAPSKRHPAVKIPLKRASPGADNDLKNGSGRSTKRAKVADDGGSNGSPASAVQYPIRKTATKPKKRLSEALDEEATPSKSQRSSQRSAKDDGEEYHGPTPRVAFSNSAIPESGKAAMKFLKSKGAYVDTINDDCNILCVKDGTLSKTMKLLQAIALGIPIVTDKWLLSSAKSSRFLPLSQFIPSVPAQEKEWNFSLERIWSQPQNTLFAGYTICFTPALKATFKPYKDIENVCKAVGARRVTSKKAGGKDVDEEDTIVLAAESDDPDAKALVEAGRACFSKDFLTKSILRGELDRRATSFASTSWRNPQRRVGRGRARCGSRRVWLSSRR